LEQFDVLVKGSALPIYHRYPQSWHPTFNKINPILGRQIMKIVIAQKNMPKLLQRHKEKISQRNDNIDKKMKAQVSGNAMEVDHLQDQVCAGVAMLGKTVDILELLVTPATCNNDKYQNPEDLH
jgi:hypothetical protein